MPETSTRNKNGYERRIHLEMKQAVTRVGVLPGHLYIFMHIKIGQVQVQNSRSHFSNATPSHVLHGDTEPFLAHTQLLSLQGLPRYTQIHVQPHVSV